MNRIKLLLFDCSITNQHPSLREGTKAASVFRGRGRGRLMVKVHGKRVRGLLLLANNPTPASLATSAPQIPRALAAQCRAILLLSRLPRRTRIQLTLPPHPIESARRAKTARRSPD